jgi:hypothetical protein
MKRMMIIAFTMAFSLSAFSAKTEAQRKPANSGEYVCGEFEEWSQRSQMLLPLSKSKVLGETCDPSKPFHFHNNDKSFCCVAK